MDKQQILDLIEELLELPRNSLIGEEKLKSMPEWTSLAILGFMGMVDESFNIALSPRSILAADSINDLVNLIITQSVSV